MKKIKLLNIYGGIGGNVSLLDRDIYEITTIEINPSIAAVYKNRFPIDKIIVCDAKEYLLKYYSEFDIIWGSPPCPSHGNVRKIRVGYDLAAVYPDLDLYQVIIFLTHYFKGKWVIENVVPYYLPLIKPTVKLGRHFFWANFDITLIKLDKSVNPKFIKSSDYSFIDFGDFKGDKRLLIRNMVNEKIGLHIINCAANTVPYSYDNSLFDFVS